MAYMNQERKRELAVGIKEAMPKDWKYSLSVQNHSTLVCTIWSAPKADIPEDFDGDHIQINEYWISDHYEDYPEFRDKLLAIKEAMMVGNWDKSDIMTDYFNVGWYIDINFGRWDKKFVAK